MNGSITVEVVSIARYTIYGKEQMNGYRLQCGIDKNLPGDLADADLYLTFRTKPPLDVGDRLYLNFAKVAAEAEVSNPPTGTAEAYATAREAMARTHGQVEQEAETSEGLEEP